jgi:hypothetical protein
MHLIEGKGYEARTKANLIRCSEFKCFLVMALKGVILL